MIDLGSSGSSNDNQGQSECTFRFILVLLSPFILCILLPAPSTLLTVASKVTRHTVGLQAVQGKS
jgi:hypothetical protein